MLIKVNMTENYDLKSGKSDSLVIEAPSPNKVM